MLTKIKNRVKSARADANSVSQILWIAIAAAVISVVGLVLFNAIKSSGRGSAARIQNSECYFRYGEPCTLQKDEKGRVTAIQSNIETLGENDWVVSTK